MGRGFSNQSSEKVTHLKSPVLVQSFVQTTKIHVIYIIAKNVLHKKKKATDLYSF